MKKRVATSDQPRGAVGAAPSLAPTALPAVGAGFWFTLALALAYCVWLGTHWLPLGWGPNELSASASRVWDVKNQLTVHGHFPWWSQNFMSGSSLGLNHARGLYLVPWLAFLPFTSLAAAGKLTVLLAIFTSAVAMYFCARHFLRNDWGAALAAVGYLLHQQLVTRGVAAEHVTVVLFFPFIPLLWLTFARALESNRLRDIFWCAVVAVAALWADNKQELIHLVFMAGYLGYWLWPRARRQQWATTAKTCAGIGVVTAALGAFILVPGFTEQPLVKLFHGDPLEAWQQTYSFKSLFGIVDRAGAVSAAAREGIMTVVQQRGGVRSQEEADQIRSVVTASQTDSPDKYAGLVYLALLAVTVLFNWRRQDRALFWVLVGCLLASVMLASGLSTVGAANWRLLGAWFGAPGMPGSATVAGGVALVAVAVFLWQFWQRKLTTGTKKGIAGAALAAFFVVPAFVLISLFPLFKEIRAPYVFWDGPEVFIGAMLLGFLVTDVLSAERWRAHVPKIVGAVAVLLVIDFWPYEKPAFDNRVPARTLANLQATYSELAKDKDPVKVYSISGRYFHLLGPMWSGKPQVYEAFYNWMAPWGTGLLNQQAFSSWPNHLTFLNLMSARYIVFDKSDPSAAGNQQLVDLYRKTFPVASENDDFVVFRNKNAHSFVSATAKACLYVGDVKQSPQLALALAAKDFTLVHAEGGQPRGEFVQTYNAGSQPFLPATPSAPVALEKVQVVRDNADQMRITLTAPGNCVAVIAESYFPFWRAELDGRTVPVLRTDCALMGVEVPAGAHTIRLWYEPPRTYLASQCVSVLAVVALSGALVVARARKKNG